MVGGQTPVRPVTPAELNWGQIFLATKQGSNPVACDGIMVSIEVFSFAHFTDDTVA